jgi:hypothetical protein
MRRKCQAGRCVRSKSGVVARASAHGQGNDEVEKVEALVANVHVSRERVGQLGHQGMGVVLLPRRGCKPSVKVIGMESVEKRRARTLGNWI